MRSNSEVILRDQLEETKIIRVSFITSKYARLPQNEDHTYLDNLTRKRCQRIVPSLSAANPGGRSYEFSLWATLKTVFCLYVGNPDRHSAYHWVELNQWQAYWAHLKRDLTHSRRRTSPVMLQNERQGQP